MKEFNLSDKITNTNDVYSEIVEDVLFVKTVKKFINEIQNVLKRKRRWTREEIIEIIKNKAGEKLIK